MTTPLAHYLVRLGKGMPGLDSFSPLSEVPPMSVEMRLAEAEAHGHAAGLAAARQEGDARLAEARTEFGATMLAERSRWAQEEGERLAQSVASGLHDLEQRIADSVASILQPFVSAALRERATGALHEAIATILSHDKRAVLRISGPEDLVTHIRERLSTTHATLDYVPGGSSEVTVLADATIIETQLEAFQQRLQPSFE